MPLSVSELFRRVGLSIAGQVNWGETVPDNRPGVYVVSISSNPSNKPGRLYESAPISNKGIKNWVTRVPKMTLDGRNSSVLALTIRLKQFWLPDETVLYVGKTDKPLRCRVRDFYKTPLGDPRPHAGGHWLKTLTIINKLTIFWAITNRPEEKETEMLHTFLERVSGRSKAKLYDPDLPLPFANLELSKSQRKQHGIKHSTLRKQSRRDLG